MTRPKSTEDLAFEREYLLPILKAIQEQDWRTSSSSEGKKKWTSLIESATNNSVRRVEKTW